MEITIFLLYINIYRKMKKTELLHFITFQLLVYLILWICDAVTITFYFVTFLLCGHD